MMKKLVTMLLCALMLMLPMTAMAEANNTLIVYFAYSENMGDTSGMAPDAISSASLNAETQNTDGNLQVMADILAEATGAEVMHIHVSEPYDPDYSTMLPRATEEIQNGKYVELLPMDMDLSAYDTIWFGTPTWHAQLPPAVTTFLKENDLSRKTIIPFGIHLGSGWGSNLEEIAALCPDAELQEGFTVYASTPNEEVRSQFADWLAAR